MPSALQPWVEDLTIMQQSVLIAAVRGPDGLHKNHVAKAILRWYRRCILISAFEGRVIDDPLAPGGGSFTGPVPYQYHTRGLFEDAAVQQSKALANISDAFLKTQDELPFHFFMHVLHAAEILGYKHPTAWIRAYWRGFYLRMVNDQHLYPEGEEEMDRRLSDNEREWRAREEVTAD